MNLYFSPSIYRQWVPREHNSLYNFILIFYKLCTCFLHSLKMCMCFSYNPCLIFCHFSVLFELCHLLTSWLQMYRQWIPCDCNFSYNFKPVFLKLCTFSPRSAEVHVVWIWFLDGFLKNKSFKIAMSGWAGRRRVGSEHRQRFTFWLTFLCPQLQRSWRGILLLGCSSVRPSVRPFVRSSRFLMHSITLKPWMLLFWNFIYGFLMKK